MKLYEILDVFINLIRLLMDFYDRKHSKKRKHKKKRHTKKRPLSSAKR